MKKWFFLSVMLVHCIFLNAQDQNADNSFSEGNIITRFQEFFHDEIRRQGVKGNWIFQLNEITGTHKFDFDNDGFLDTLMEFNAIPVEGGGIMNQYVVLFRNLKDKDLKVLNYTSTDGLVFDRFESPYFLFKDMQKLNSAIRYKFKWEATKFVKVEE